jgi:hypothetical protein
MGLTVKKKNLSKEDEEKIEQAKLEAKALRERGCGEMFADDISEEDEEYMQKFRSEFKNKKSKPIPTERPTQSIKIKPPEKYKP